VDSQDNGSVLSAAYVNENNLTVVVQATFWDKDQDCTISVNEKVFKVENLAKEGSLTLQIKI